jgi:hypothetical protein
MISHEIPRKEVTRERKTLSCSSEKPAGPRMPTGVMIWHSDWRGSIMGVVVSEKVISFRKT